MEKTETVSGNITDMPMNTLSREKYWGELSVEEKVERIRTVVKQMQYHHNLINEQVDMLEHKFENHQHQDKEVVMPLKRGFLDRSGLDRPFPTNSNDQYF